MPGCFLVSLTASCEDVVEALLISPILFLIVRFALFVEHFDDGFEFAMGSLVYLHPAFALEFQNLKAIKKRLPRFSNRLDSVQE